MSAPQDPIQFPAQEPYPDHPTVAGAWPAADVVAARPARRTGRRRRVLVAVAVGAAVLGGGAAAWAATGSGPGATPTAVGSAPAGAGDRPGPGAPPHRPHIDGTVTAVSGSTITVTDHDGFTRTIKTSSSTTYTDGLSAPVAVGTTLFATGTVDADHTSLDATTIGTAPTGGPFGPGGPRHDGPPPTDAPTGAPSGAPSPTSS